MGLVDTITELGSDISINIPENYGIAVTFMIYFVLIAVYSIFIWKFYKFLAKREIISLNLSQYNRSKHPLLNKFVASLFYIVEYIIVIPILVLFWFAVLGFFILLLSENQTVANISLVTAAIVGVVRFTSYISEDLSKDVAKLFPFTILVIFIISPGFFSVSNLIFKLSEVPLFFKNILIYLAIVAALEIVIRLFTTVYEFVASNNE